nr:MAG TPA: hypothetical protein [Caudoviricetes sp.]
MVSIYFWLLGRAVIIHRVYTFQKNIAYDLEQSIIHSPAIEYAILMGVASPTPPISYPTLTHPNKIITHKK